MAYELFRGKKKKHTKKTHTHRFAPILERKKEKKLQPNTTEKKTQLAQTQHNTTNIKTVSCGTNVAIFE